MAEPRNRLHHVLSVGAQLEKLRLDAASAPTEGLYAVQLTKSRQERKAPSRSKGEGKATKPLPPPDVEEQDAEREKKKLEQLQTWLRGAVDEKHVINDPQTRLRLGLPEFGADLGPMWYTYETKDGARLHKFRGLKYSDSLASRPWMKAMEDLWGYTLPSNAKGAEGETRKQYIERCTREWVTAINKQEAKGLEGEALQDKVKWQAQELRFPGLLFLSDDAKADAVKALNDTWQYKDSLDTRPPNDIVVAMAASLIEMAKERLFIYAERVRSKFDSYRKSVERSPVLEQQAPEYRARQQVELYLDAARQEYARAWTLFDLNSKELFVLARHMCCKLADALQPLLNAENVELLEYIHGQVLSHLAGGAQRRPGVRDPPFRNIAITGTPGSGKTFTADQLGAIFAYSGILLRSDEPGSFKLSAGDLIGEYVGQTDARVEEQMRAGAERTIFLDEAYLMGQADRGDSSDAITKLVQYLSENAGTFVLVAAGYPDDMDIDFFGPNPGLRRRFASVVLLEDLLPEKLVEIWARALGPAAKRWDLDDTAAYLLAYISEGKKQNVANALAWRRDHKWRPGWDTLFETQADSMQKLALECRNRMLDEPQAGPPTAEGCKDDRVVGAKSSMPARAEESDRKTRSRKDGGAGGAGDGSMDVDPPADPSTEAGPSATNREELRKRMEEWEKEQLHRGTGKTAEKYKANYACSAYQANNYGVEELRECMTLILTRRRKAEGTTAADIYRAFDEETPPPNYAQPWTDASPTKVPFKDLVAKYKAQITVEKKDQWLKPPEQAATPCIMPPGDLWNAKGQGAPEAFEGLADGELGAVQKRMQQRRQQRRDDLSERARFDALTREEQERELEERRAAAAKRRKEKYGDPLPGLQPGDAGY